jgi:cytochrome c peroxidase
VKIKLLVGLLTLIGAVTTVAQSSDLSIEPRDAFGMLFGQIKPVSIEAINSPLAQLGRKIYWDSRLSSNGQIACATCHMPEEGSADKRSFSIDAKDKPTARNSQPVYNAMLQTAGLRWVSDRSSGSAQAEGSMTGSMGHTTKDDALESLRRYYSEASFAAAFPMQPIQPIQPTQAPQTTTVSLKNMAIAVEAYEATLNTPAPFDRYLAGDNQALTAEQKAGMRTFVETGCVGCHSGALLGGSMQMKFGVTKNYWLETKSAKIDEGKFLVTKDEADKYVFRVPMLRNIAETGPYFHDGSVSKLFDAVKIMASVQLGRTLPDSETRLIVAFLRSLSGNTPANYSKP